MKKETAEQLEAFRQQREAAEKALLDEAGAQQSNTAAASPTDQETWLTSGKKRRRPKEKEALVGKLRKMASTIESDSPTEPAQEASTKQQSGLSETQKEPTKCLGANLKMVSREQPCSTEQESPPTTTSPQTAPHATSALGLGGYSSDED